MSKAIELQPVTWERMIRAVEKVRERLLRATAALEQAGIPYAVVGGNAVAAWVSRVDESAVRNTADVDVLINRSDLPAVTTALEQAGFRYQPEANNHIFLDGPHAKARDVVRIFIVGEMAHQKAAFANPELRDLERSSDGKFTYLGFTSLVTMMLSSYRLNDRVDCIDLINVGLIDRSWLNRLDPILSSRLQALIDDPNEVPDFYGLALRTKHSSNSPPATPY